MPSSQERLPKQVAQGVCPSLLRPPPLKQDCIISPLGGCCPTWCDHLKSPKEELCLTTNCTHGQGSSQERGCESKFSLLGSELPSSPQLRTSISHSRDCQVIDEGVEVVRALPKGADHDAVDTAVQPREPSLLSTGPTLPCSVPQ